MSVFELVLAIVIAYGVIKAIKWFFVDMTLPMSQEESDNIRAFLAAKKRRGD